MSSARLSALARLVLADMLDPSKITRHDIERHDAITNLSYEKTDAVLELVQEYAEQIAARLNNNAEITLEA